MTTASIIGARLDNAAHIIAGAKRADLPLHLACALAELESMGVMTYGNDLGMFGRRSYTEPANYNRPVTAQNFQQFLVGVLVEGKKSNGVGITQITAPALILDAIRNGYNLADAEDNVAYGARHFRQCIADARGDIGDAATLYRHGTLTVTNLAGKKVPADRAYADRFTAAAAAWERILPALTYTVKPGDTLWGIARTHGTNVDTILALNPTITDPAQILPGQVINLA